MRTAHATAAARSTRADQLRRVRPADEGARVSRRRGQAAHGEARQLRRDAGRQAQRPQSRWSERTATTAHHHLCEVL